VIRGNPWAVIAAFLLWSPVVVAVFRVYGRRAGTLVAVVGGNLLLPGEAFYPAAGFPLRATKELAAGLALALGVLSRDGLSALRFRPRWVDLPAVVYAAFPLCGLASGGPGVAGDAADMVLQRVAGVLIPYAAARRYLGDAEGARRVAVAVVLATLAYVPVCAWETLLGPRWYLAGLCYGTPAREGMVQRLGGWRPEGFFTDGILLAEWMALGAVMACWLWAGRLWRPRRGPAWWPPLVLVLASVACRGVYGYITLGVGLAATLLTIGLRTRWALAALSAATPAYLVLRVSGVWDAGVLTGLAGALGRPGTVAFRLASEDAVVSRVVSRHPALGFGNYVWHIRDVGETLNQWPDGLWLTLLWSGGLAGLALHAAALHLFPAGLALGAPTGRPGRVEAGSAAWALALFTALSLLDSLHNPTGLAPVALVGGSLVGLAATPGGRGGWAGAKAAGAKAAGAKAAGAKAAGAKAAGPTRRADRYAPSAAAAVGAADLGPAAAVAALACLLYVFGHGRVAGHESAKFVGGLGAGLLFAASGWVGAWSAAAAVPMGRAAAVAGLFAAFGVSFNLALHPAERPAFAADILQGLALCGLAVAGWRRLTGGRAWADAGLAGLALAVHFLARPVAPVFPGSRYLLAAPGGGGPSLFPLCPWLALAALGSWARSEAPAAAAVAAGLFAAASALGLGLDPGPAGPSKSPMDLNYAMLACASAASALAASRRLVRWRGVEWLGRRWLVFFYAHFAVAVGLGRVPLTSAWAVWPALAAGGVAATWLVCAAAAALPAAWSRGPGFWLALAAVISGAGAWTGLPPATVAAVEGLAGLAFAANFGALAWRVVEGPAGGRASAFSSDRLRFALVLAALAAPEAVGRVTGSGPLPPRPAAGPSPSKAGRPATGSPDDGSPPAPAGDPGR